MFVNFSAYELCSVCLLKKIILSDTTKSYTDSVVTFLLLAFIKTAKGKKLIVLTKKE